MRVFKDVNDPIVKDFLRSGGVGILRTDTLYGMVARADNEAAVKRVYQLKKRSEHKSPIVLISSTDQLFDVPSEPERELFEEVWPGKVSVVVASKHSPIWLRRENNSVAYRIPDDENLRNMIREVGPLIAPSANPEGHPPAATVSEAFDYFGEQVDFYVDGGGVEDNTPSRLIRIQPGGEIETLR